MSESCAVLLYEKRIIGDALVSLVQNPERDPDPQGVEEEQVDLRSAHNRSAYPRRHVNAGSLPKGT
jgi:hypothetical protein